MLSGQAHHHFANIYFIGIYSLLFLLLTKRQVRELQFWARTNVMFADCPNLCLCISVVNTHESDTVYLYSFCKKQAVALIQHHSNNQTASEKKKNISWGQC